MPLFQRSVACNKCALKTYVFLHECSNTSGVFDGWFWYWLPTLKVHEGSRCHLWKCVVNLNKASLWKICHLSCHMPVANPPGFVVIRRCFQKKIQTLTLVSTYSVYTGASLAFNEETFCEVRITEYVAMGVTHNTHRPMLAKTQPVRVTGAQGETVAQAGLKFTWNYGAGNITIKKPPVVDKSLDCDMLW